MFYCGSTTDQSLLKFHRYRPFFEVLQSAKSLFIRFEIILGNLYLFFGQPIQLRYLFTRFGFRRWRLHGGGHILENPITLTKIGSHLCNNNLESPFCTFVASIPGQFCEDP